MTIKTVVYKDGHKGWLVLCTNRHETGNCNQKSCVLSDDFFDGLYQRVVRIDDNLQWQLQEHDKELTKYCEILVIKEKEFKKNQQAIERLYEMREEDSIDKNTFLERKNLREKQIQILKREVEDLEMIIQEQLCHRWKS